jgi:hypothetical protein
LIFKSLSDREPAVSSTVKPGKASFLQPSIRIDVRWVLDGLLEDGRISEASAVKRLS